MSRGRAATLTYLLLVFGSGTLVGAVAHRLFTASSVTATAQPAPAVTPAQMRQQYLANLRKHVGASEEQVTKVNALLDDAKRRYNELDQQAKPAREKIDQERNAAILSVFTPDQQKVYLAWRAEVRAKREKERLEKERAEKAQASQTR
jgi:tRNA A37 threonylcarbamoyladenosine modification protein TsaB